MANRPINRGYKLVLIVVMIVIGILASSFLLNSSSISNLIPLDSTPEIAPRLETRAVITTLEDVVAGKFPSASDNKGTDGTLVEVDNLRVLKVIRASDGDWHVDVTDGKMQVFITEITPLWQTHGVKKPPEGAVIDIVGTVYCDKPHESESWHGNTCWEIHPVISWRSHNNE